MITHCRFCGEPARPNTMFCPACGQIIGGEAPAFRSAQAPPPFHTTGGRGTDAPVSAPPPGPLPPVPLPDLPAPSRSAAPRVASPPPAPGTRAEPQSAGPPAPAPAAPAGEAPTPQAHEPGPRRRSAALVLRLPDGAALPVDRTFVLGRTPGAGAAAHGGDPIEIPDPHRSMSRVHLVVAPGSAGGILIRDAGSANGTVVLRDGSQHDLAPGESFEVRAGDRIVLGDVAIDVG